MSDALFPDETRPIILICGCKKYQQYLVAAVMRMTRPEWRVVAMLGDPTLTEPQFAGSFLKLPVADTYEALPAKVHAGFSWCAKNFPASPGVFKTDDDILFTDKAMIFDFIMSNTAKPYWGIRVGSCEEGTIPVTRINERFTDTSLRPAHQAANYAFGWGYWLSREVLPVVVAAAETYNGSFLEDVCTGYVMNSIGIEPERLYVPILEFPRIPDYLSVR